MIYPKLHSVRCEQRGLTGESADSQAGFCPDWSPGMDFNLVCSPGPGQFPDRIRQYY